MTTNTPVTDIEIEIDTTNLTGSALDTQQEQARKRAKSPTRPAILAADLIDEIDEESPTVAHDVMGALEDPEVAASYRRIVAYLDRADKLPAKTRRFVVLALTGE